MNCLKPDMNPEFTEPDEFQDDNLITIAYMDPATNVVLGSLSLEVDVLPRGRGRNSRSVLCIMKMEA